VNNWIDSNIFDRFSNEILKTEGEKINIGEKMPIGSISNGHLVLNGIYMLIIYGL